MIADYAFFEWLENNVEKLVARDSQALAYAIDISCQNKAAVVAADETEQGVRAILNLGHTFGHAIETGMGYGEWLHGEAVAAGMVMAAELSHRLSWISRNDIERTIALLQRANLPVKGPNNLSVDEYLQHMAVDKKVLSGKIRLVLLKAIGQAVVTDDFDMGLVKETIAACTDS